LPGLLCIKIRRTGVAGSMRVAMNSSTTDSRCIGGAILDDEDFAGVALGLQIRNDLF
jgi:hypothetical protein